MDGNYERTPFCYHCGDEMEKLTSPSINLKNNLDWEGEFLWICVNDRCPVYVNGFYTPQTLSDEIHLFRSVVDPESGACALAPVSPFTSADVGALLDGLAVKPSSPMKDDQLLGFAEEGWSLFPTSSQ